MNNILTETTEKRYWTMGELVDLFNCPASQIRFWVNFFGIRTDRTKRNYRKFMQEDLDKISKIKSLVTEGYHLKAIKNKL